MKVLSFTALWPNHMQPLHGLFVRERIKALADLCELRVVAPVPWFIPVRFLGQRYYNYSQVVRHEKQGALDVFHPRYLAIPKVFNFSDGFLMFATLRTFIQQIRNEFPFDLIDAHWAYPDGYAAWCLAKEMGLPFTLTVRGSDITAFAKERLRGYLIHRTLVNASQIICVSESLQNHLTESGIPPEKTHVIENGVDCHKFSPVPKHEARNYLNLPANAHIVLSVGHLCELKGFHLIIEAVSALQAETALPVYLFIVGGDASEPYSSILARQIAENSLHEHIFLAGPRKPDELKYWYSAADVFCLASSSEGCPNVILESLACGTPVVATKVGGIPKIIESKELGILVERNVKSICKGIAMSLEQTWDFHKISAHARHCYSWKKTAGKIYNIFEGLQL